MKKKIMMTAAIAAAMTAAISFGTMAEENEKIEAGGLVFEIPAEYRDLVTDTPEITLTATYSFEGLTRIAPAE